MKEGRDEEREGWGGSPAEGGEYDRKEGGGGAERGVHSRMR